MNDQPTTDNRKPKTESGQTLVMLLIFMAMAVSVTTAAVILLVTSTQNITKLQEGNLAYSVAESGLENAILRLIRNPSYTGETLSISGATVTSTVSSGAFPKTVTSVATQGDFVRTVTATVANQNGIYTISDWSEIP